MEYFPAMLTREQTEQLVTRLINDFEQNDFGLWATELKETGEFMGFVGLTKPTFEAHFTPCVEVGWRLAKEFWGETVMRLRRRGRFMRDGFERVGLEEIVVR